MKFHPSILEERAAYGYTHRLDFDVTDIPSGIANSTAYTFNVAPLPNLAANTIIREIECHLTTPFSMSNANFNSVTLNVGDGGSATRYVNALQVGTTLSNYDSVPGGTTNFLYNSASSTNQQQIQLNSMANFSLSQLTAGRFYVLYKIIRTDSGAGVAVTTPFSAVPSGYS